MIKFFKKFINDTFQDRVIPWLQACFPARHIHSQAVRNHHFLEEANELTQALGMTREVAHSIVDYVHDRAAGHPPQEVGGVMVTLAALCHANKLDMHQCGEDELQRIWSMIDVIREKQKHKPQ